MENLEKKKVVTFGEVMMRLSPLAYLIVQTRYVAQFPNTNLGRAATQSLQLHWNSKVSLPIY